VRTRATAKKMLLFVFLKTAVVRVFKNRCCSCLQNCRCSCLHEQLLPLLVSLLRVRTRATAKKMLLFVFLKTAVVRVFKTAVVRVCTNNSLRMRTCATAEKLPLFVSSLTTTYIYIG
ncbi:MAG: hypothetical protein NZM39_12315, partial [Bernardetiaceae bacterium]|nr:hypothetical protein [Bernardetiaceae bacterium]